MRREITTAIKASGGKIWDSGKDWATYLVKMNEEDFLQFREKISFVNVWHGSRNVDGSENPVGKYQSFFILFSELGE